MIQFFMKGGPLMWPILISSLWALTIILERVFHFHRAKIRTVSFTDRIRRLILEKKPDEAEKLCGQTPGPVAAVVKLALHERRKKDAEKNKLIARAGSEELHRLERHVNTLGIIAHVTPLMGLLGTVTGMIRAFMEIQKLGGQVDASVLAGGIWEALITTAFGLSVAIPAMIAYHYFDGRVETFARDMKNTIETLFNWVGKANYVFAEPGETIDEGVDYGV